MEKIVINGGKPLYGDIWVSGMKNSAVAVIIGSLLIEDKCVIENLPDISDVAISFEILQHMGASVRRLNKTTYEIDNTRTKGGISPSELVRKMRASYYLLGAELGRFHRAYVDQPGGCYFGERPIDQHVKGFEALGGKFEVSKDTGYYKIEAPNGLKGASVFMDVVSVGATINTILAAVKAEGMTVIENPAKEPHVVDLANFLNTCGANVSGAGTDVIKIKGVNKLHGCSYAILPDMIEAGTCMAIAAATGGCIKVENVIPKHLESITAKLVEMGVEVEELDDAVIVSRSGDINKVNIKTQVYPGVPTDMNAQMCVLMCLANGGTSYLTEGVFENKFRYCEELRRMGAVIKLDGKVAAVEGRGILNPAVVKAVDLRAGAAMVVAGLAAKGRTEIEDIHHIERGYEDIVKKLRGVGADIKKIVIPEKFQYEKAN
ncbi:MAG: UDP-N-acetylglucosamine 1-carboxyvinyltransferase [Oscillospiraceae bacterium]|nr:UDP-N-acetylglucosamine 1-carboxyvinyltransferase [Oscillospiraceae bacterium]